MMPHPRFNLDRKLHIRLILVPCRRSIRRVNLALDNRYNALPVQVSRFSLHSLVLDVDDALFEDVAFFDFREEASERAGELASLEVQSDGVELACDGVEVPGEGVGGEDMGGVGVWVA